MKEVQRAIDIIIQRVKFAFKGVPPETRKALENGNTEFLRELHGGARLYPDTDSKAIFNPPEEAELIRKNLPEFPWITIEKYQANRLFNYLCKRAVHHRLSDLVKKKYLKKESIGYSLTNEGFTLAISLKERIKTTRLRTVPRRNEEKILEYLYVMGESYRNELARELKINPQTIRDTIGRLLNRDKVEFVRIDRFQRRFYRIKE